MILIPLKANENITGKNNNMHNSDIGSQKVKKGGRLGNGWVGYMMQLKITFR